jgi:hypothetical protein
MPAEFRERFEVFPAFAASRFLSLATVCGLFAFVKKESLKPNAGR